MLDPTGIGKSLSERGLLLLLVWLFLDGSVLPLGAASSPDVTPKADLDNHKVSEIRHNETKKLFPVLDLDYKNVRTPFEIALWVLLASLMKLGEYRGDVMQSFLGTPAECAFSSRPTAHCRQAYSKALKPFFLKKGQ